jgi:hypothetical protein
MPAHDFEYEHLFHWLFADSPLSKEALENHVRHPILSAFPVTCTLLLAALYALHCFVEILRNPKWAALLGVLVGLMIGVLDPWISVWHFAIDALRFDIAVSPYRLVAKVLWLTQNWFVPGLFDTDAPNLAVGAQDLYNRVLDILRRGGESLDRPGFEYRPLRSREIRLLRVSRWFPMKRLEVKVEYVFLGAKLPYEAISYTWGNPLPTQEIRIDGCSLSIPHGAYNAIVRRASFFRTRWLWLDAVCINQDDESEKYRQLPMMRDIYCFASRVVVWLGDAPSSSEAILAVLSLFYTAQKHKGPELYAQYLPLNSRQNWLGLVELLNHQWFHRSWIIQEVTVPSKVHVVYGGHYVSFDVLISVMSLFFELDMASLLLTPSHGRHVLQNIALGIRNARMIWQIRSTILKRGPLPWSQLLSDCMDFQATKPEDKIFSLQNLTTELLPPSLLPDPEQPKSPRDVYVETARSLLRWRYVRDILPFAGVGWRYRPSKLLPNHPSHPQQESPLDGQEEQDLPSWVPDWSATMSRQLLSARDDASPYLASCTLQAPTPTLVGESKDQLLLAALPIDTIFTLGSFHDLDIRSSPLSTAELENVKNNLYNETLSLISSIIPPTIEERDIWRFMIGDWADGKRPAANVYADYHALFQALLNEDPKPSHAMEVLPVIYHYFQQGKSIESPEAFLGYWETLTDEEKALFLGPFSEDEFMELLPGLIVRSFGIGKEDVEGLVKEKQDREVMVTEYLSHVSRIVDGRRFCVTRERRIGFVPPGTKEGDRVFIVKGARTPFVVRDMPSGKAGEGKWVRLVGECYLHGVMDGEMVTSGVEWKQFVVV